MGQSVAIGTDLTHPSLLDALRLDAVRPSVAEAQVTPSNGWIAEGARE